MLRQQLYVTEKLDALQRHAQPNHVAPPQHPRRPMVAALARTAGRHTRRLGEALESWGAASAPAASTNRG